MCGIVGPVRAYQERQAGWPEWTACVLTDTLAQRAKDDAGAWESPDHNSRAVPSSLFLTARSYNFLLRELRQELQAAGRRFRSYTETESSLRRMISWESTASIGSMGCSHSRSGRARATPVARSRIGSEVAVTPRRVTWQARFESRPRPPEGLAIY